MQKWHISFLLWYFSSNEIDFLATVISRGDTVDFFFTENIDFLFSLLIITPNKNAVRNLCNYLITGKVS